MFHSLMLLHWLYCIQLHYFVYAQLQYKMLYSTMYEIVHSVTILVVIPHAISDLLFYMVNVLSRSVYLLAFIGTVL